MRRLSGPDAATPAPERQPDAPRPLLAQPPDAERPRPRVRWQACPTSRSSRSRRRRSTTSPLSSSGTRACSPAAGARGSIPMTREPGSTAEDNRAFKNAGGRGDRARGTGLRRRPRRRLGGVRHHPRSCPTSNTARSTSPLPNDCPTTGSPASRSSASHRGQGLAAVALRGAVGLIAQAGGGLVEGYPHDTGGVRKKNSSFLYNGTRTMYEREGFTYDRPKGQGNCVMVREVAPSARD